MFLLQHNSLINLFWLFISLLCISSFLTFILQKTKWALDHPNHRSSHQIPTPRTGGIAILASFYVGILIIYLLDQVSFVKNPYFITFLITTFFLSVISIIDDFKTINFKQKFLVQFACAILMLSYGLCIPCLPIPFLGEVNLGIFSYIISLLWIIGLTNSINFMDGLDGLAGSGVAIATFFFALISYLEGSQFVYLCCIGILTGCLGFLCFNLPPAKIFMGDVGSQFLGFSLAILSLIALQYDITHTSFYVMPLLLLHFIWDSLITVLRRVYEKARLSEAHRTHLFQLVHQLGYKTKYITLIYALLALFQGLTAMAMIQVNGEWRLLFFIPFLIAYAILTKIIWQRARAKQLI